MSGSQWLMHCEKKKKKENSVIKLYHQSPKCVFPSNLKQSNSLYLGKDTLSLGPNLGRSTVHECENNSNKTQRPSRLLDGKPNTIWNHIPQE